MQAVLGPTWAGFVNRRWPLVTPGTIRELVTRPDYFLLLFEEGIFYMQLQEWNYGLKVMKSTILF